MCMVPKRGDSALYIASVIGRLDAARVLLEAGARKDVRHRSGKQHTAVVRSPLACPLWPCDRVPLLRRRSALSRCASLQSTSPPSPRRWQPQCPGPAVGPSPSPAAAECGSDRRRRTGVAPAPTASSSRGRGGLTAALRPLQPVSASRRVCCRLPHLRPQPPSPSPPPSHPLLQVRALAPHCSLHPRHQPLRPWPLLHRHHQPLSQVQVLVPARAASPAPPTDPPRSPCATPREPDAQPHAAAPQPHAPASPTAPLRPPTRASATVTPHPRRPPPARTHTHMRMQQPPLTLLPSLPRTHQRVGGHLRQRLPLAHLVLVHQQTRVARHHSAHARVQPSLARRTQHTLREPRRDVPRRRRKHAAQPTTTAAAAAAPLLLVVGRHPAHQLPPHHAASAHHGHSVPTVQRARPTTLHLARARTRRQHSARRRRLAATRQRRRRVRQPLQHTHALRHRSRPPWDVHAAHVLDRSGHGGPRGVRAGGQRRQAVVVLIVPGGGLRGVAVCVERCACVCLQPAPGHSP
jgi:hypothetical protein